MGHTTTTDNKRGTYHVHYYWPNHQPRETGITSVVPVISRVVGRWNPFEEGEPFQIPWQHHI